MNNNILGWILTENALPPDETPVLIVLDGEVHIGEIRWENPGWEETYEAFQYWDNPNDDGQDWTWHDVTHWMPIPSVPPKHSSGYAPKPPSPPLATWKPVLSQQEQEERNKLIESGVLPF